MAGYLFWLSYFLLQAVVSAGLLDHLITGPQRFHFNLLEALMLVAGGLFFVTGIVEWLMQLLGTARAATAEGAVGPTENRATHRRLLHRFREELIKCDNVAAAVPVVDAYLRQVVDYDLLRIAVFDSRGTSVTQHCYGRAENLLTERNKPISTDGTDLGHVYRSGEWTYRDDLADSRLPDDRWLSACGADSSVTIPLKVRNGVVAALTVAKGHRRSTRRAVEERRQFLLSDLLFSRNIGNALTEALMGEQRRQCEVIARRGRHSEALGTLGGLLADLPKRLSTPLTSIIGRTDQLILNCPPEDLASLRSLTIIRKQADRITRELRNIQELRRQGCS
jgi:K+-sensing histidine kinase KdpD